MSIPSYEQCMLPLLQLASDGKEYLFKDAIDVLIKKFNLTEEEKQILLPSGSAFVINNRIGWARTYLTKAGLLLKTKRGFFQISDEGKKFLARRPTEITTKMLKEFDSFNEFQTVKEKEDSLKSESIPIIYQNVTPHELIESGYQSLKSYFQIWCMNVVKRLTDYYRVTRYHL